jgi:hypothetical protein
VMTNEKELAGALCATEGAAVSCLVHALSAPHDVCVDTTHTPGPWTLALYDNGCFTVTGTMGDMHGAILCSRSDVPDRFVGEGNANAHLIAAAPDYHEAVADALTPNDGYNCEYVTIPRKAWQKILAAHAKAEGR